MKISDLSLKMRKKFVDDYRLPIKIFTSPYFEYFTDLYWSDFKLEDKFNKFQIAIDTLGEEAMQKEWYRLKDQIKEDIQRVKKYAELETTIFNNQKSPFENTNPYSMEVVGKTCVSIDIITANFTALKLFDESLVFGAKNYKEFISTYTPLEYFHDSKIFRQLTFEPLLAKKQGQIQKNLILEVTEHLKDKVSADKIKTVSNDELVLIFDTQDSAAVQTSVQDALSGFSRKEFLKSEVFTVKSLTSEYFYKESLDGSVLLRKAPASLYPQLFKKIKGMNHHPFDLLFVDGETKQLAQWIHPLFKTESLNG